METNYWPFVRGINRTSVFTPNQGPVMKKIAVEQTVDLPVIWDAMALMWRRWNVVIQYDSVLG